MVVILLMIWPGSSFFDERTRQPICERFCQVADGSSISRLDENFSWHARDEGEAIRRFGPVNLDACQEVGFSRHGIRQLIGRNRSNTAADLRGGSLIERRHSDERRLP